MKTEEDITNKEIVISLACAAFLTATLGVVIDTESDAMFFVTIYMIFIFYGKSYLLNHDFFSDYFILILIYFSSFFFYLYSPLEKKRCGI